jgi:hypothetical protein
MATPSLFRVFKAMGSSRKNWWGKEFFVLFVLDKSLFLPYFSLIIFLPCSDYARLPNP